MILLTAACQQLSAEVTGLEFLMKQTAACIFMFIDASILAGEGGLTSEFKIKWQDFIQALSRGLSNSHKVAAHTLKLHIAIMQAWDK